MRISDWSSDVCSSDLDAKDRIEQAGRDRHARRIVDEGEEQILADIGHRRLAELAGADDTVEVALEQGHARAFHRNIGAMPHRDADIRRRQRRRVIDPIARHGDDAAFLFQPYDDRSEKHTSEPQSLMRISYAVFSLKQKKH